MKPVVLFALLLLVVPTSAPAQENAPALTAQDLLTALDDNMVFETREALVTMKITRENRVDEKELRIQSKGHDTAYTEFLAPPRDEGIKYLKLERNLWMWLPDAERVVKISGHMLRQGMMGSDFSYEDMLESPDLASRYDAEIVAREELDGVSCAVLELVAHEATESYPKRRIWIDEARRVPIRQELYALTGKLIKRESFYDFQTYQTEDFTRVYPSRFVMQNLLQQDTETEIRLTDLTFGVELPDRTFTLSHLKRGN